MEKKNGIIPGRRWKKQDIVGSLLARERMGSESTIALPSKERGL